MVMQIKLLVANNCQIFSLLSDRESLTFGGAAKDNEVFWNSDATLTVAQEMKGQSLEFHSHTDS